MFCAFRVAKVFVLLLALGCFICPIAGEVNSEDEYRFGNSTVNTEVKPVFWVEYAWELFGLTAAAFYMMIFFSGKSKNDELANKWFLSMKDLFEAQFSAVGCYQDISVVTPLYDDSADCFKFWASGRRYCDGVLATLDLVKRQDLISKLLAFVDLSSTKDYVTLDYPMSAEFMQPFVFALCKKKEEKKLRKVYVELENLGASHSSKFSKEYVILTDCPEVEENICGDLVTSTILKNSDLFLSMHFTDQAEVTNSYLSSYVRQWKNVLRFKFLLPEDPAKLQRLTEMSVFLVDVVANLKFTTHMINRSKEQRAKIAKKNAKSLHEQRMENVQKKKEEERQLELERRAKMNPEQLAKLEEKERKDRLKRNGPKAKIMR